MTHYDTLEISRQASPEVVRAAYKSLMQRWHPDRNPGDTTIAGRAAAITEAYDVLSDPLRRAAYDEQLAAASTPGGLHAAHPAAADLRGSRRPDLARRRPAPSRPGLFTWIVGLAAAGAVVWGAIWLASPKADARSELLTLRNTFSRAGEPEERLRELYARKEVLLRQSPELQAAAAVERASNLGGRTLDVLDAPLVIQLEKGGELTVPRLRVVLGTFDTATARAFLEKNRDRLVQDLSERLTRADGAQLGGGSDHYLKTVMVGALAKGMGTRPDEDYPSSFHESPGRHGVVDVLLPESYVFKAPPPPPPVTPS